MAPKRPRTYNRREPAKRRKRPCKRDFKKLWKMAIEVQLAKIRPALQRAKRQQKCEFEIERQALLQSTVESWYSSSQERLLKAFLNHAPATQWVSKTILKIRSHQEAEAKRLLSCRCGGVLTSSWDVVQNECRACNLGLIGNICYCTSFKEEELTCNQCGEPGRVEASVKPKLYWSHPVNAFRTYFPRLWNSYQISKFYYH